MDNDQVASLPFGAADPTGDGQRPLRTPAWPQWQDAYPATAPGGHPYVLATLRMTVPGGRHWQQHRLVEDDDLPSRLGPLFSTVPVSHSLLQEPHGGQHCRFSTDGPRLWQDDDPDHWPNTLYRQHAQQDGPRPGLGEVAVTIRLESRDGLTTRQVSRTISECNVRADARLLLAQVPHRLTGDRP